MDIQAYIEWGLRTHGQFDGKNEFAVLDVVDTRVTGNLYAFELKTEQQRRMPPITESEIQAIRNGEAIRPPLKASNPPPSPAVTILKPRRHRLARHVVVYANLAWCGIGGTEDPARALKVIEWARAEFLRMIVGCSDFGECGVDEGDADVLLTFVGGQHAHNDHPLSRFHAHGDHRGFPEDAIDLSEWLHGYGGELHVDALAASAQAIGLSPVPSLAELFYGLGVSWIDEAILARRYRVELLAHAAIAMHLGQLFAGDTTGKEAPSHHGRALASLRHLGTQAERDKIAAYWRENIDPTMSAQKAADVIVSAGITDLAHKKIAEIVSPLRQAALKRKPRT